MRACGEREADMRYAPCCVALDHVVEVELGQTNIADVFQRDFPPHSW